MKRNRKPDVKTQSDGSIVWVRSITDRGREWISDHCDSDPWQHLPGAIVAIDVRCAYDVLIGMIDDGLSVQDERTGCYARKPKAAWGGLDGKVSSTTKD